jgi:hypothetical protein
MSSSLGAATRELRKRVRFNGILANVVPGWYSAVALAARLKALDVDSLMAERNARAGDNWALRYDCMRCFHIPTSFCHLSYMVTWSRPLATTESH